jgi:AraC-like DNA-binding protein
MSESLMQRRVLAQGEAWALEDILCTAGPKDRSFEERHGAVAISQVCSGTFQYRTATGDAVLYPGSFLLGNTHDCFECGHAHSHGDRCLSLRVSQELFAEVAASNAGSSRFKFAQPMLPARAESATLTAALQRCIHSPNAIAAEEAVYEAVGEVQRALSLKAHNPLRPNASELRRLSTVLRHIETHLAEDIELDTLASLAAMSKYHFLRVFARSTGSTPHRYILSQRLRHAATSLAQSIDPISHIVLRSGFNDVSTFNRYFQRTLKCTPTAYRARFRTPGSTPR